MQTFIVSQDHKQTAQLLDKQRLNKQILEGYQILRVLAGPEIQPNGRVTAWAHHPAVMMWIGHTDNLNDYVWTMLDVAEQRGINVSTYRAMLPVRRPNTHFPSWWNDHIDKIIASHQASLYRKNSEHYAQWANVTAQTCCKHCNYWWPTHDLGVKKWLDGAVLL